MDFLHALQRLADQSTVAVACFNDGAVYELRIISTAHASAGGDIVAEVLRTVSPGAVPLAAGDFMNFKLSEVVQVRTVGRRTDSRRSE